MRNQKYLITINNPTLDIKDTLEQLEGHAEFRYACGQLEEGAEGTKHH
jgi:hypothetical protein